VNSLYNLLKRFPYIVSLVAGAILFFIAGYLSENLSGLVINVSASLFTIPLVIYSYELIKEKIAKDGNKDLYEYVKMNVDRELMSLLDTVAPFSAVKVAPGLEKILYFIEMNKVKMKENLSKVTPFVFNLATKWSYTEDQLATLLSNEVIYNNMSIEERNAIIRLIKATRTLEYATNPKYYTEYGVPDGNYKVIKGSEFDLATKFQNRYLLMKRLKNGESFRVAAFNDLDEHKFKIDLLTPMKPNAEGQKMLFNALSEIQICLEIWLKSRGREFILDSHVHKLVRKRQA